MKVRWGVIGAGGIADRRTIPGLIQARNAELVAVMGPRREPTDALRVKYGAKRAYTSEDELLADPEIDAVYIASPVEYHKRQALKVAAAGKHLLLEKPAALTVADGREIVDACRAAEVLAAAGFMMRFHAYHQAMREIVQSGKIGQIVSCRAQLTCWYPDIENCWRQQKSLSGGGAMMDMGIHCLDLLQYIIGSKVKRIAGLAGTKTFKYDVDDSAAALIELENGAFGFVDANFNIPDAAAEGRLEIYGTGGSLLAHGTISQVEGGVLNAVMADTSKGYDAQQERNEVQATDIPVDFGNMYQKEIESFGRSILDGQPVEVPLEDALQSQELVEKFYQSAQSGAFV